MTNKKLSSIKTTAPKNFNKEKTKKELQKLKFRLEELQNLLFAENKHALLVVLQGMDASGKDGAIKNVFDAVNPMGCHVYSFKAPTTIEAKHDFLWRIHQHTPEKGMINIFNRSHYEDVLIQRVHKWVDEKTIVNRFEQINDFEKLLQYAGTAVLKFYLHISKEEQLQRLNERMNDKTKMWKYNANDIKERVFWNDYQKAYEDVFSKCSKNAEWTIVPADQNWYKEFVITSKVVETLENFKMKFPGMKKE